MIRRIAIIGYGEIGKAIDTILSQKDGLSIERWDKDVSKVSDQKSLNNAVHEADVIFLGVQSWIHRSVLSDVSPYLQSGAIVVSFAKGIETDSHKTIDQVIEESLPSDQPFALCLGPMLADELKAGMQGVAVIATRNTHTYDELAELFSGTMLLVEHSLDVRGIALAGILKNVYAMLLGVVDALGMGLNMKGYFTAKALTEMRQLLPLLGGRAETVDGIGCLADFVATSYSAYSRNRRFGEEIVRHGKSEVRGEGIASFESLLALIGKKREEYPLLSALRTIIIENADAKSAIAACTRS